MVNNQTFKCWCFLIYHFHFYAKSVFVDTVFIEAMQQDNDTKGLVMWLSMMERERKKMWWKRESLLSAGTVWNVCSGRSVCDCVSLNQYNCAAFIEKTHQTVMRNTADAQQHNTHYKIHTQVINKTKCLLN